jgi:hypothetical protein
VSSQIVIRFTSGDLERREKGRRLWRLERKEEMWEGRKKRRGGKKGEKEGRKEGKEGRKEERG